MPKFIVRVSRTIDMAVLVNAKHEAEAFDAELSWDNVLSIDDGGWDTPYEVEAIDSDYQLDPCYTREQVKEALSL